MGKQKLCPKCGKPVVWSKKDKLAKMAAESIVKTIPSTMLPGVEDVFKENKDCCIECWNTAVRTALKPVAGLLGKAAETWPGQPTTGEASSPGENPDGAKT
jgi:hypothetical protein